ncbi:hypothetical protein KOR34_34540 [Posidoniimonas corsicana]|uniref:Uncharacterized protein n=1 Tax=Posidoniimonas corsicana TaxID=1938618 RepID=A0A5C5V5N4_9BACT|nr:hypothetical protein [Posidoniimonas corsicana]TWT33621.1 hypothetical protein KOR34_34540 [Posidoniimonas corsicana]
MRRRLLQMLCISLTTACAPSAQASGYEAAPSEVELTIGRTKHVLVEGVSSNIQVNGRSVPVKVELQPAQRLHVDNFSFSYPTGFTVLNSASEGAPTSASWMLKGRTCQITIHRKAKGTTLNFLADHMAEFYEGLPEVSDLSRNTTRMTIGRKSVSGVRFLMKTRREGVSFQDYFQLPTPSSQYNYFLVIHAKPGDQSEQQARTMIGSTLR